VPHAWCLCLWLPAGAFIQGSPVLSWVGNNTAKLQLQHGPAFRHMQCWTLISTNSYGQVGQTRQSGLSNGQSEQVQHRYFSINEQHLCCKDSLLQLCHTTRCCCCLWSTPLWANLIAHCTIIPHLLLTSALFISAKPHRPTRCLRSVCQLMWQQRSLQRCCRPSSRHWGQLALCSCPSTCSQSKPHHCCSAFPMPRLLWT
jgi:hypothetical protein